MTLQLAGRARPLGGTLAFVAIGVLAGLVSAIAATQIRPVLLAFAFGGVIVLISTMLVRDQRSYWLFLLVLSIPFEIGKRMSTWLVDPWMVLRDTGPPLSGTISLNLYLTDIVLFAMVLPWLVRLCLRRERFYFPKIGYIFLLYLSWSLIVSLIRSKTMYLSLFEWCREVLYFLLFIYIINNVETRAHLRTVVAALLLGLAIGAAAVITLYSLDIGTEFNLFSGIYATKAVPSDLSSSGELYAEGAGLDKHNKRSAGLFEAPGLAAYHLEFTLPFVLACLMMAVRRWHRILFASLYGAGCTALYLTFSRSGLVGFLAALPAFFVVARWSGLISRRIFAPLVFVFVALLAVSTPLIVWTIEVRLQTASYRLQLLQTSFEMYLDTPVLGASYGAALEGGQGHQKYAGRQKILLRGFHNHYLAMLTMVGPIGFVLFFGFFWRIAVTAWRVMRPAEAEMKLVLVGAMGAFASIAVHNLGDGFGGHANSALLWLYAGLIIAIARQVQAERPLPSPVLVTAPVPAK